MNASNARCAALILCAFLVAAVQARAKTILPDSCGDDKVKFDVKTGKNPSAPAPPPAGKAQIVFIEDENRKLDSFSDATIRFGLDGKWVGATNGDSFFTVTMEPGVHHVCANIQASAIWLGMFKKAVDTATFTAEAGKVYYFAGFVKVSAAGNGRSFEFNFAPISEDEGKSRVKTWQLATWKTR